MTKHLIKTWSPYFQDLVNGEKTFEVRWNDRDYSVGDQLELQEFDRTTQEYSGRKCVRTITYVLQGGCFGIESGYVVLGLK